MMSPDVSLFLHARSVIVRPRRADRPTRRVFAFEFLPLAAHARETKGAQLELVAQTSKHVTLVAAVT